MSNQSSWSVLVVGAGHAGVEAAAAAARMGAKTLLLTLNLDTIAKMSCNPAIGGLAKGQIVREVDALGGLMAKAADATAIQFRLLNRSKGAAVRSPRAQCDRWAYSIAVKQAVEAIENLDIRQETVTAILVEGGRVTGVACGTGVAYGTGDACGTGVAHGTGDAHGTGVAHGTGDACCGGGVRYEARTVVLATGTFLSGLIHIGEDIFTGGRSGEPASSGLSDSLRALGFPVGRLKTGTPPRLNARTIDFKRLTVQPGDDEPVFFSFATKRATLPQVPCHIAYTNERTHEIIRANLDRSPVFSGQIKSTGPRYCPSIETKVVRFEDRSRHQLFLEPEGLDTNEIYLNGASTSLPREVQEEMVRSVEGLENAEIMRYGYAVEYDYVPPTEIYATLETKRVGGLFFAGQINGTSGYEEAAGQGLLAGANAALMARGDDCVTLSRHEAYIGVMVDDLVTKGVDEPYRMFTSRAEYRLLLRYDNADMRLTPLGRKLGLVGDDRWESFEDRRSQLGEIRRLLASTSADGVTLERLLSRPEVTIDELAGRCEGLTGFRRDALELAETQIKYAGYIMRQEAFVEKMRRSDATRLPREIDYDAMAQLTFESREKLKSHRPETIGQASRIPGVNPADISILLMYLKKGVPLLAVE